MVRSNYPNAVMLAVSISNMVQADELWVTYRTGKHSQYLSARSIASSLAPEKASVFLLFHALTGYDTV